MSDYKVEMYHWDKKEYLTVAKCKVKHFRQYEGRNPSTCGGHTALFDLTLGHIHSSKCRSDEPFSRRKGVLTCIQKMFEANFKEYTPLIVDYQFIPNGCKVWITRKTKEEYEAVAGKPYKPYFWL